MGFDSRFHRYVLGAACALSLACAENRQQQQIDRAQKEVESLQQYEVPRDYREQIETYFGALLMSAGPRTAMFAAPDGAIVCGHVKADGPRGGHVGYQPFGAIFDRGGALKWIRIFQPFQGMYVTSLNDPRPTDDDVAIAMACNIPLVF